MKTNLADEIVSQWDKEIMRTHSKECWKWHAECAVAILADEIFYLRNIIFSWVNCEQTDGFHSEPECNCGSQKCKIEKELRAIANSELGPNNA